MIKLFIRINTYREGRVIINIILSKRLRQLRREKQLKQKDVAMHLCCAQSCYSHYEVGDREMPIDAIVSLANFYNVSVDYLLGVTDERKRH